MIDGYYVVDYQVHSVRSHDGKASIFDHCLHAAAIGIDEIGFSEHKDFDPNDPVVDYFDYDAYMKEIEAVRQRFGRKLKIRAGVEIDYQYCFEDKIANYVDTHPFDFVIGSVHYVNRVMVMTPEYNKTRNARLAYADYFHAVRDSVVSNCFDIVGHLEYANRRGIEAWGPYNPEAHRADLINVFDRMIDGNYALEINTAGLCQGINQTYPTEETVAIYTEHGGERIAIGSDAHHPDQLAHAYAEAARIALANGITQVCTWENRKCLQVPLKPA